jgi:septum formation protein
MSLSRVPLGRTGALAHNGRMPLILASASPRRADLLTRAGFMFDVSPAEVDESARHGELPDEYALRVARDKAEAVAASRGTAAPLLSADTVVVADGRLLGKPADEREAVEILRLLSGRVHAVYTAVVVLARTGQLAEVVTTRVRFVALSEDEIRWYVSTGEPFGKAGAYAIQGRGSRFVDWIEGSWSNVVGLPVATAYRLLKQAGVVCSPNSSKARDL